MRHAFLTIIFFVAAFICLFLEFFVVPGFGVVGILGFVLLGASILYSWINLGAAWGAGLLALSFVLFGIGIWLFARTRVGKRLVLDASEKGAVSAIGHDHRDMLGKEGEALSNLRPVGAALIEGQRVDVATRGTFVRKGSRVKVVDVSGPRIVVEEIEE